MTTFANREGRVVVTLDADVLCLYAEFVPNPGIVYLNVGTRSPLQLIRFLTMLHDDLTSEGMIGRIEYA